MSDLWSQERQRIGTAIEMIVDASTTLLEFAADNGPLGDPTARQACLMAMTAGETARGAALLAQRAVELLPQVDADKPQEEQTWDTNQLTRDFNVKQFSAPFVYVVRKSDGVAGTLQFRHSPRVYWGFVPAEKQP